MPPVLYVFGTVAPSNPDSRCAELQTFLAIQEAVGKCLRGQCL